MARRLLAGFDWKPYEAYIGDDQHRLPPDLLQRYITRVTPALLLDPPAPIVHHQRPTPIELDCTRAEYSSVLTGKRRDRPVRLIDSFPFAYELDLLEVRLYEHSDAVDYFLLTEATVTQRLSRKNLFFGGHSHRYGRFHDRLFHLVLDDRATDHLTPKEQDSRKDYWRMETYIRKAAHEALLKMADSFDPPLNDNDLIMHSDLDEVYSGELLYHLKHCEMKRDSVAMRWPTIMHTLDFLVEANPQAALWTFGYVKAHVSDVIGFPRGVTADAIVNAGWHMSRFGTNVLRVVKHLALAEGGVLPRGRLDVLQDPDVLNEFISKGQRECCADRPGWMRLQTGKVKIPWFVHANRERFPHFFFGERNDVEWIV